MYSAISVEIASIDDALDVTNILTSSYSQFLSTAYDPALLQHALPLIARANPKLLESGSYFVARDEEGSAIACGGWTAERPVSNQTELALGHIRHFAVSPKWIRKGIGRRIYDACERQAKSRGVRLFEVYASLNALPFYQSLGFGEIGEFSFQVDAEITFTGIRMQRRI